MDTERHRTARKRIWATIIDFIVFMPLMLVPRYVFTQSTNESLITGWSILSTLGPIVYTVLLHKKYGQTIGKWAADVKVLDASEERLLTWKQAILRSSVDLLLAIWTLVLEISKTDESPATGFLSLNIAFTPSNLLLGWFLANFCMLLINEKRRTVRDLMAASIVIRVFPKTVGPAKSAR